MSSTEERVLDLGHRWSDAEQRGDVDELSALATDDFTLVGPVGFVLTKRQWLDRYRNGDLVTTSIVLAEVAVRDYGEVAVAVGVHTQQAAYHGNPANGRFRTTHIAVRRGDTWLLAGMHLSPIGGPPPFAQAQARQGEA
jgi:ketosteroid isomerase-like protein